MFACGHNKRAFGRGGNDYILGSSVPTRVFAGDGLSVIR
jgi:hypothetical protein